MKRSLAIAAIGLLVCAALGALIPRLAPLVLSRYRPDIWFAMPTHEKVLFITIDDAPSRSTQRIIQTLKRHQVPATFFVIADRVTSPTQLTEIVDAGYSLGKHLKTTRACSKLTLSEFRSDFDTCAAVLKVRARPQFFRPPSDFGTKEQIAYAKAQGCQAVMGTVFPLDHWITDPAWLVTIARWQAVPGGIVILHDGDVRGETTAAVLDELIPKLRHAGYRFGQLDGTHP